MDNDGASMFNQACQGMEHCIGNCKGYCKLHGSNGKSMVKELRGYLDMNTTCSIYRNLVDFRLVLRQLNAVRLIIFDPIRSPMIENQLLQSLPEVARRLIDEILNLNYGDPLTTAITKIMTATEISHQLQINTEIRQKLYEDSDEIIGDSDILHLQSDEYLAEKLKINQKERQDRQHCNTKSDILAKRKSLNSQ